MMTSECCVINTVQPQLLTIEQVGTGVDFNLMIVFNKIICYEIYCNSLFQLSYRCVDL